MSELWAAWGPALTLFVGALGAAAGWLARRPKDVADARAVAAQTDINIAAAMQTQYAKLVADLATEVDRRRTQEAQLRTEQATAKTECQERISALEAELKTERQARRGLVDDMAVLVARVEELEDRLRGAGLDANGTH